MVRPIVALVLCALLLASCGVGAAQPNELVVFAASSLTDAFTELGKQYEAEHAGAKVVLHFAGSDKLAAQIREGAPADVFASANGKQMTLLVEQGNVRQETVRPFAANQLVLVVPSSNPAQIEHLVDLAKPGIKLVFAQPSVPVGGYSLEFLSKASALPEYTEVYSETVLQNVVSYEENVRAVLNKVSLAEADAGIVYRTDAASVSDGSIMVIDIPADLNSIASYPIAPIAASKQADQAQAFVDFVLSPAGQQILAKYGFSAPAKG